MLHFIHIRKTGGTAIKHALADAGLGVWNEERARRGAATPHGPIVLHRHDFRLSDVPHGEHAFFCVRDPIARFASRFQSRLAQGLPGHFYPWNDAERQIFERYPTAQSLAAGLAAESLEEREHATWAMINLRHQTHMRRWLGTPGHLRVHQRKVVYIARQETLDRDFEQLKRILELPDEVRLPADERAHRSGAAPAGFDEIALRGLRSWYDVDFELLRYCDSLRAWRGWGVPAPGSPRDQLELALRRLRGIGAVRPTLLLARNRVGRARRRLGLSQSSQRRERR